MVQTVVRSDFRPDPVISILEHTELRSIMSDYKAICVFASIWVALNFCARTSETSCLCYIADATGVVSLYLKSNNF